MLKKKKVLIPAVALITIVILALAKYNMQPIDVFLNVSDNTTINNSNNSTIDNPNADIPQVVSSGSYSYYDNFDEADRRANLIIVGEVVKVNEPEEIRVGAFTTDIYTVSEFRVDKVIKGDAAVGDIVKVKQIGGEYKGIERVEGGIEYYKLGERHILFLKSYKDGKYKSPCSPINPHQGSMKILNGKTKKTNNFQFINDDIPEDALVTAVKEKVEKNKTKKEQEKAENK
jgi:hypothetical protein